MKFKSFLLPGLALGTAGLLIVPGQDSYGFSKIGGSLPIGQRDFRVLNTFADVASNNNTTEHPNWPGWVGADLAIWKGCAEWQSGPFGDGTGDGAGTNPNIGDGGADFDAAWMGASTGIGNTNENIHSPISSCGGGGTLAFTETPISDGWRIRYCENWTWADGPDSIGGNQFDLQGVACHEYGHALGLGHSDIGAATMFFAIGSGSLSGRSIAPDDSAGVQCVYGVKSSSKPEITFASPSGSNLTIMGSNFDPDANHIWFTQLDPTTPSGDPRVRVLNVPSTGGGTQIDVTIPNDAGPGNILVQLPGSSAGDHLSNAFPFDPDNMTGGGDFPNVDCAAEMPLDPVLLDVGGDPNIGPRINDLVEVFDLSIDCSNVFFSGTYSITLKLNKLGSPAMTGIGFIWGSGPKLFKCGGSHNADLQFCVGGGGLVIPNDMSLFGISYLAQGLCTSVSTTRTSSAIQQTVGL